MRLTLGQPALQLTQHCRLVGIVTGTPSKVAEWQTRYGIEDKDVYSYETMGELIDNPDIDVVYVVTPNHVHPTFVIAAARAKKHSWCEKPLAMTAAECQSMIDACNENGEILAVGYRLQHEPNTQPYTGVSGGASDGVQFNQPIDNQQAKQMDDNALAIIEGRPLLVPGEEGLRTFASCSLRRRHNPWTCGNGR